MFRFQSKRKVAVVSIVEIIYFDASISEFIRFTAPPAPRPRRTSLVEIYALLLLQSG
jgi:hypothetical protein